ncbi:MAG: glycosyltransferase family 2 protein [Planctomycetota bacterium]
MSKKIAVVIPIYNEERFIGDVLTRLLKYPEIDIILVNDGSTDQTLEVLKSFPQIHLRQHPQNQGKGAALQTAFHFACEQGYSAVVTMDGDGQHDPIEIPKFFQFQEEMENLFLIGNRMQEKKSMPLVRWITNVTMSGIVSWLAHAQISDSQCGYRRIGRNILNQIHLTTSRFDTESEILIQSCRLGFPVREVPIETIYGTETSKIRVISDTIRFIFLVLRYLIKPIPYTTKKIEGVL